MDDVGCNLREPNRADVDRLNEQLSVLEILLCPSNWSFSAHVTGEYSLFMFFYLLIVPIKGLHQLLLQRAYDVLHVSARDHRESDVKTLAPDFHVCSTEDLEEVHHKGVDDMFVLGS